MDCTDSSCLTHHILIDPARSTKGGSVPSAAAVVGSELLVGNGDCLQSSFPETRVGASRRPPQSLSIRRVPHADTLRFASGKPSVHSLRVTRIPSHKGLGAQS
jgi:hypothetical protein